MQMRRGRDGVKSARQIIEALALPSDGSRRRAYGVRAGQRSASKRQESRQSWIPHDHNDGMVAEIADILPRAG
jgi:hypothetical protein